MITQHQPLAPYTTLKVGGAASYFTVVATEAELVEAVAWAKTKKEPIRVIGGGSNLLVSDEGVNGLVIKNNLTGFAAETMGDTVLVTVEAGEVFDTVVAKTVAAGWWGLENLSHIPGSVGATPVQNVGAYGVEVKDVITAVRVFDTETESFKTLAADECDFGYRDSVFKTPAGQRYIICSVTFALTTYARPHVDYRDLAQRFAGAQPTLTEIREAVIEIRSHKFPDWQIVGTAGSFFKNPFISKAAFESLTQTYPDLPSYVVDEERVKIPLGFVLDKILQIKGVREGAVGTYEGQALVMVNYGGATATDIVQFAARIAAQVKEKIGIEIEWEVTRW